MKDRLTKKEKSRKKEIAVVVLALVAFAMEGVSISIMNKIDIASIIWMSFLLGNIVFAFLHKKFPASMRIMPMLFFGIIWIVSELLLYMKDEVVSTFSVVLFVLISLGLIFVVWSFYIASRKNTEWIDSNVFLALVLGLFVFRYIALMTSNFWFVSDLKYNLMFTFDIIAVCCFLWGNKYLLKA